MPKSPEQFRYGEKEILEDAPKIKEKVEKEEVKEEVRDYKKSEEITEKEKPEKTEKEATEKIEEEILTSKEREHTLRKFEQLCEKEKLLVRFVNIGEFESSLRENRISGEFSLFPSFKELIKRLESYGDKRIGQFWSRVAEDYTDWPFSAWYPGRIEWYLQDAAAFLREESKKSGEKEKIEKTRKRVVKKLLKKMWKEEKLIENSEAYKFIECLVEKDKDKEFLLHRWKEDLKKTQKETENPDILEIQKETIQFFSHLLKQKNPEEYLASNMKEFRRFLKLTYTSTKERKFLPYNIMLIFKNPIENPVEGKLYQKERNTFYKYDRMFGPWGKIDWNANETLLAAINIVPEREFIQKTADNLTKLYYKEDKKQTLIPFFGPRLNLRWPKDKILAKEIKERTKEIKDSIKKENKIESET